MLEWFEKFAPIRAKFRALFFVFTGLAVLNVGFVTLAGTGTLGLWPALSLSAAVLVVTVAAIRIAGKRICDPYVNTVLRMEALAAGDTRSPIAYTDHTDCVGRMTAAMSTFRDNAETLAVSSKAQQEVVDTFTEALMRLADNDLAVRIDKEFPGEYEKLRGAFNRALGQFDDTVGAVRGSASSVLTGSSEIRAASEDLAQRNERQAANLEETAAAINQITAMIQGTAESARKVQKNVAETHDEAAAGGKVVGKAVEAMDAIEKSSSEIEQIINVIDGIAFQTNLLALNAGVEAARAGDAGKGFAVVANEVRALAQRSAEAASNIKELIINSSSQVGNGVSLVGEAGKLLETIVTRVGDIDKLMSEIADGVQEQAENLQQANTAVADMDKMTQQNAAMVEQSTAASRSLAEEAGDLERLVAGFHSSEHAQGSEHPARRARPQANSNAAPRQAAWAPARRPQTSGNLALAAVPAAQDDWSAF